MAPIWNIPPPSLSLSNRDMHIWRADLNLPAIIIQKLAQTLSTDETARAKRFRLEQDRRRFIAGRAILRIILGYYLSVEPGLMQFSYGKYGKPRLTDSPGNKGFYFSMSRSGGLALYGFTRDCSIGVDIERIRDIPEMDQIARQFFSTRENAVLRALPESKKAKAFFNCWTRKEAFIKAIGKGLSQPLDRFDVSLIPGESARLLRINGDSKRALSWSIQELKPASGFVAALAVKKRSWQLRCWQWVSRLPRLEHQKSVYRN